MRRRAYTGSADLAAVQAFNGAAMAATGGCGYLHPGDIPHRLFNGNKLFDPSEIMTLWEDGAGIAAWVMVGPRHRGFDAQVRPDLRGDDLEAEVLEFAEGETVRLMDEHRVAGDSVLAAAHRGDTVRRDLLVARGWELEENGAEVINRRALEDLPDSTAPEGYRFRSVRGVEEADAVAAVHAASFGSEWTPELYARVMTSPGYDPRREFVAEAPDGTLGAFAVTWHDPVTSTGLFEPVGTHPDHRRRGLAAGLLTFGMQAMAAAGMKHAIVGNLGSNEASRNLYLGAGFEPWQVIDDYAKPVGDLRPTVRSV